MATFGRAVRRGLPRVSGGDPWPPASVAPIEVATVAAESAAASVEEAAHVAAADAAPTTAAPTTALPADSAPNVSSRHVRRGLPRVPGGEPWPPAGAGVAPQAEAAVTNAVSDVAGAPAASAVAPATASVAAASAVTGAAAPSGETSTTALRRGLPRVAGGEPWPPAGFAPGAPVVVEQAEQVVLAAEPAATVAVSAESVAASAPVGPRPPLTFTRTVWPGRAATQRPVVKAEPERVGPFTKAQWAGTVIVGGIGLLIAAGLAVAFTRWFLSLDFMGDFIATYPGEYHLPEGAPVGLPAWLGWQHFFNVFLMVLIIRTGLQVRNDKRPAAFWSPKSDPKRKISLSLWFHQSLDILWVVNGVVFVVLLFVTGQWMRIVPTSWEVFPNLISAGLQYVSLDWPTENGWVNYNSLQQIAYFTTVFVAAPLALLTGVRMSGIWPKNAKTLSRVYPVEWARAVHFPVMLYFVAFIVVHVGLVFATGALRNLNHMYAAQGSVDPNAYAGNWAGFWIFVASVVVIVGAWAAARPLVLAPIARLFGEVKGR